MWRNILKKMHIIRQHLKEISNVLNKYIPRYEGPPGSGDPTNIQNIIICLGFFPPGFLSSRRNLDPLIYLGINFLLSIDGPIYPVAPTPNHLPTSLDIDHNFNWISASVVRLWLAFLFGIHVPLVFSTPNSFLFHLHFTCINFSRQLKCEEVIRYFLLNRTLHLIEEAGVNLLSSRESSVIRKLT